MSIVILDEDFLLNRKRALEFRDCVLASGRALIGEPMLHLGDEPAVGSAPSVMNKIFEVSLRQDSLSSAFRKLTARNSSIIPVVEDQRLIGIFTLQNLMHSMALLAESRKLRRDEAES